MLGDAGAAVMEFFSRADPAVGRWNDPYTVVLADHAWTNLSLLFRLMDRWGLPRSLVTQGLVTQRMEGVPPSYDGPEDRRWLPHRMRRAWPALLRSQRICLWSVFQAGRALRALDAQMASAHDLPALYAANVAALTTAIRTDFAFNALLPGVTRARVLLDERREWFRAELMRRRQRLRAQMLAVGKDLTERGEIDTPEDVLFLRGVDLNPSPDTLSSPSPTSLREAARAGRARYRSASRLPIPLIATSEEIEHVMRAASGRT